MMQLKIDKYKTKSIISWCYPYLLDELYLTLSAFSNLQYTHWAFKLRVDLQSNTSFKFIWGSTGNQVVKVQVENETNKIREIMRFWISFEPEGVGSSKLLYSKPSHPSRTDWTMHLYLRLNPAYFREEWCEHKIMI